MYPLSRFAGIATLSLAAVSFTGCAALTVNSYVERNIDFSRYHTYNWDVAAPEATGDPRLDNNPFFQDRIRADVEKELNGKGFEKTTTSTPDLLLHYHASMQQRIDVNGLDRERGYCDPSNCQPFVYDAGTILLDVIDARTKQIVWRGWAEDSMDGIIDNQRILESRIDDAVAKILQRLPRTL